MTKPVFPLTSERLLYRPNLPEDFEFLLDLHSRPDVVRFLPWDVLDAKGIEALLLRRAGEATLVEDDDKLNLICLEKTTGTKLGEVGLFLRSKEHQGGEVGYAFHPDHHGRGYAKEATRTMLALGFDFFGLHRIMARCDERNKASEAIMKTMGMRHEATYLENWNDGDGTWSNEIQYAILKREWDAGK